MFDSHAQKNILIVMLQIFDNLFHYKNIVKVQWIKRLKLCMVTMATLPPAKELKIQVVSWQNEIRTLDVLKSPTCERFSSWHVTVGQIMTPNIIISSTFDEASHAKKKNFSKIKKVTWPTG